MGHGSCDSRHWDNHPRTANERAIYWENQAMQLRAELNRADKTLQKFALKIAAQNRDLAYYRQSFGPAFITPRDPKEDEQ